jgi:hypothetical protein
MALSRCYYCLVQPDLLSLSSDFITIQGKQPPETPEKIWEQSNGRIKSYGSFESLLWFGMTTSPFHRVVIPSLIQEKRPMEAHLKI